MQRMSGLEACCNLVELDLSANAIHDISSLSCLKALRKLVLSHNRIIQLSGLEGLVALEHLLLQDNCLRTEESVNLAMLQMLPQLCTLYLKDASGSEVRHASPTCVQKCLKLV
jgi:Leucine-rich repeat (LRR) protein